MDRGDKIVLGAGLGMLVLLGVGLVYAAHREAEVFNRCTGSKVTWKDALFVELRVETCPEGGR